MNNDAIIEKLKSIVKPYVQSDEGFQNLNEDTDFLKDLKINSANLIDIVLDVEDEFDITIENEEMEQMISVKPTIAIIQSKIESK